MKYSVWKKEAGYTRHSIYSYDQRSKEGMVSKILVDFESYIVQQYGQNALTLLTVVNASEFKNLIEKIPEKADQLVYGRLLKKLYLADEKLLSKAPTKVRQAYYDDYYNRNDLTLKTLASKVLLKTLIQDLGPISEDKDIDLIKEQVNITLDFLPQVMVDLIQNYLTTTPILKLSPYSEAIPNALTESYIHDINTSNSGRVYLPLDCYYLNPLLNPCLNELPFILKNVLPTTLVQLISEYCHEVGSVNDFKNLLDQFFPIINHLKILKRTWSPKHDPYRHTIKMKPSEFIERMLPEKFATLTEWIEQNETELHTYLDSPSRLNGKDDIADTINFLRYGPFLEQVKSPQISSSQQQMGRFLDKFLDIIDHFSENPHKEIKLSDYPNDPPSPNGWAALESILKITPLISFLECIRKHLTPQEFLYTQLLVGEFLALTGHHSIWSISGARLMTAPKIDLTSGSSLQETLNNQLCQNSSITTPPISIMIALPSTPGQLIIFARKSASSVLNEAKIPACLRQKCSTTWSP